MPGLDSNDWTAGTGDVGTVELGKRAMEQDSCDKTGGKGQDSRRRQSGFYRQEKKQRTGWPEHDSKYRATADWTDMADSEVWHLGKDH
jgi:hypothetical protein